MGLAKLKNISDNSSPLLPLLLPVRIIDLSGVPSEFKGALMKKRILVVLTLLMIGTASTTSAAMKHYGGNAPIDTIEKNQRGGE